MRVKCRAAYALWERVDRIGHITICILELFWSRQPIIVLKDLKRKKKWTVRLMQAQTVRGYIQARLAR